MTRYPILFGYRDLVAGNGFVAVVSVSGRALIEDDHDGVWMIGINPGGFAAQGSSQQLAALAFREEYRTILYDIADSAADFDEFRAMVQEFREECQPTLLADWKEAVEAVRQGVVDSQELHKRDSQGFEPSIKVDLVETSTAQPQDNPSHEQEDLAA